MAAEPQCIGHDRGDPAPRTDLIQAKLVASRQDCRKRHSRRLGRERLPGSGAQQASALGVDRGMPALATTAKQAKKISEARSPLAMRWRIDQSDMDARRARSDIVGGNHDPYHRQHVKLLLKRTDYRDQSFALMGLRAWQ